MGRRRRDHRWHLPFAKATALAFLLFASSTSALGLSPTHQPSKDLRSERLKGLSNGLSWGQVELTQSRLNGPGSSPPRCISKCGSCRPCKPVRIAIHPGLSMPLEYYPEAWRCKCGNKLFMP